MAFRAMYHLVVGEWQEVASEERFCESPTRLSCLFYVTKIIIEVYGNMELLPTSHVHYTIGEM
jgi:hypothetical protein